MEYKKHNLHENRTDPSKIDVKIMPDKADQRPLPPRFENRLSEPLQANKLLYAVNAQTNSKPIEDKFTNSPKKPLKESLAAPPNILYQIFYENLESKKASFAELKDKSKLSGALMKPSTIIYNDNKVTQEVIQRSQFTNQFGEKKISEEVNNSIKDIIFNDGLLDAFDDNNSEDHNDNNEILRNLEDKSPLYFKKEFTEVIEEEMLDMNERHSEEARAREFINLREYPEYFDQKNQILLKACSLFDNSIIMDNRYIMIYCKTEKEVIRGRMSVQISLTYKPKMDHLIISTHLLSSQVVKSIPALLTNQPLLDGTSQTFIYECRGDFEIIQFPKLQVSLSQYHNHLDFLIPVPFSINKFSVNSYNNPDMIADLLDHVS